MPTMVHKAPHREWSRASNGLSGDAFHQHNQHPPHITGCACQNATAQRKTRQRVDSMQERVWSHSWGEAGPSRRGEQARGRGATPARSLFAAPAGRSTLTVHQISIAPSRNRLACSLFVPCVFCQLACTRPQAGSAGARLSTDGTFAGSASLRHWYPIPARPKSSPGVSW